jgi:FkbM family methyltransferase
MRRSLKHHLKRLINSTLEPFGLEICRKTIHSRTSLRGALEHAKNLGFYPNTVIDVGAATGTSALYETFPASKQLLIEPLEEFKPHLDRVTEEFPNSEYVIASASQESGTVTINVHPDLVGSSMYLENEDSDVNGSPRVVPAITLDKICLEKKLDGPFLIKVDVQGAELDVLMGATHILGNTEYVLLEVSFFQFFEGGPQISDVIKFMNEKGFVGYDMFDFQYRLLDGAMSQADIAFVKESGQFREFHFYAKRGQRKTQTRMIIESLDIKG